jgi:polyhydroxyalkanoate synthesis regulator phasin
MARDEEFEKLVEEIIREGRITPEQAEKILSWWQRRPPINDGKAAETNFKQVSEWMRQKPEGIKEVFPGIERSHSNR